ncbi:MAG TPA: hypothetical protein VEH27_03955 [Methylomirabilota bacterium]|nr:hypothetical protein [Methylomirabilota bacterium]
MNDTLQTIENLSVFRAGEQLPQDNGRQPAGQICLANEARFTSTHFSSVWNTKAPPSTRRP